MDTQLAFFRHPHAVGVNGLDASDATVAEQSPAEQTLSTAHATDAHFVCYGLRSGGPFPRLNKPSLPFIRLAGDDITLKWIAVDIDNKGHNRWGMGEVDLFVHAAEALSCIRDNADTKYLRDYAAFWTTRAGCRFLYELNVPVGPAEHEPMSAGIVGAFNRLLEMAGLHQRADLGCTQWNRLFRLPNTMRDGVATADQDYFVGDLQLGKKLSVASIAHGLPRSSSVEAGERPVPVQRIPDSMPDEASAYALFELIDPATGRMRLTSWAADVKNALKGREYFASIFEFAPIAEGGARDTTLYKAVASVTGLLYGRFSTTPAHVFSLFLNCVRGLAPDAGTPNWSASLWHKVKHSWALEDAKRHSGEIKLAEVETRKLSVIATMAKGMGEWYQHPGLVLDEGTGAAQAEAVEIVGSHLIAALNNGREFYVMQKEGRYWPMVLSAGSLIPAIRKQLGEDMVRTQTLNKDGTSRDTSPIELINMHGTLVGEVTYEPGKVEGGVIRWADTDRAKLVIVPFSRNPDLTACFNPLVDQWLLLMFGEDAKFRVEKWIAWACAFEEGPIACLSIKGPSGCGKSLFADGLREVLRTPSHSSFDDLTGDWQYSLVKSPFVFADEGLGSQTYAKTHPADQFRRMIGRSETSANRKNLAPVTINVDVRMLMTSNNLSLVRSLTSSRDLTPEDRIALLVRLLHVEARPEASDWLRVRGGRKLTKGWVSDGRSSDYVIARHFLWLYDRRSAYGQDARLLVEGDVGSPVMSELRMHGGIQDRVLEAIVALAGQACVSKVDRGVKIADGNLYVLPQAVLVYVRDQIGIRNARILEIREAMLGILKLARLGGDGKHTVILGNDRREWYPIDIEFIARVADQYGWKIDTALAAIERSKYGEDASAPAPLPFMGGIVQENISNSRINPLPFGVDPSKMDMTAAIAAATRRKR